MTVINKLSNGIRLVMEPMPYLKSVAFGVWVKVGSRYENKTNNGIAHLIEHMLFKGTKTRSAKDLADEMAMIGGNINAFTSKECTSFYGTTLSEHLPVAVDIISDMLKNSLFDEKDLKKEKGVIVEEIDMYDDSPEDLSHEMLQKKVWKEHPLGYQISGTKKIVNKITREQILDFMDTYYVGENMIISIAGQFDQNEVMELLEEKFGDIKNSTDKKSTSITTPEYHKAFYKKEKDVEQLHLNIAFDCISSLSEEQYTLSVLNSVLGGSINSRLFLEIRDKSGLTYDIYSYGSSYMDTGLFQIYAAMNPSQYTTVVKKIEAIINDIRSKGITHDELAMTKEQLKTEIILSNEGAKSRMDFNGNSLLFRGGVFPVEEIVAGIDRVSLEDIKSFAKKYLELSQASVAIVGNIKDTSISTKVL